jgi:hypothetical protein
MGLGNGVLSLTMILSTLTTTALVTPIDGVPVMKEVWMVWMVMVMIGQERRVRRM